jgi:hypothetical protein
MAFLDDTDTIGLIVLVMVLVAFFIAAARCRKYPPG